MSQRIPAAVARKEFASVLKESARGERIKLTRYDKTIAVIIPKRDLDRLEDCEKHRAQRRRRPSEAEAEAEADAKADDRR